MLFIFYVDFSVMGGYVGKVLPTSDNTTRTQFDRQHSRVILPSAFGIGSGFEGY
jgi:hypothetical protein